METFFNDFQIQQVSNSKYKRKVKNLKKGLEAKNMELNKLGLHNDFSDADFLSFVTKTGNRMKVQCKGKKTYLL